LVDESSVDDVTVIVPTRHEAGNVAVLAHAVGALLDPLFEWHLIFVDDSDDETVDVLTALVLDEPRVSFIHRPPGDRAGGLSGAVLRGLAASDSRFVAVMDADLQHPPAVLLPLLAPLGAGSADIVVATRYRDGGSPGGLAGPGRRAVSAGARALVHLMLPSVRRVSDPLGGLFAFDRSVVDGVELRPSGFKILLEVLARGRWDTVAEVPYEFAPRLEGASKANVREGLRFLRHLGRLWTEMPSLNLSGAHTRPVSLAVARHRHLPT
jgi:dolichol-phosphate mannosyltransferase